MSDEIAERIDEAVADLREYLEHAVWPQLTTVLDALAEAKAFRNAVVQAFGTESVDGLIAAFDNLRRDVERLRVAEGEAMLVVESVEHKLAEAKAEIERLLANPGSAALAEVTGGPRRPPGLNSADEPWRKEAHRLFPTGPSDHRVIEHASNRLAEVEQERSAALKRVAAQAERIARLEAQLEHEGQSAGLVIDDMNERIIKLEAALAQLMIDANRLCDRQQGGTYEDDCRRALAAARAALASPSEPQNAGVGISAESRKLTDASPSEPAGGRKG